MTYSLSSPPYQAVVADVTSVYIHKSSCPYQEVTYILIKADDRCFMGVDTSAWDVVANSNLAIDVSRSLLSAGYLKEILPETFSSLINTFEFKLV